MSISAAMQRDPSCWLEDAHWHRSVYDQSHFRWLPEEPIQIALRWLRWRLVFETPAHLQLLEQRLYDLRTYTTVVDDAMAVRVRRAEQTLPAEQWETGSALMGLSGRELQEMQYRGRIRQATASQPLHALPRRVLTGWPFQNPISQVWELNQMRRMYIAAADMIDDALCDLVLELVPRYGWHAVSQLMRSNRSEKTLRLYVGHQRDARGEPGDPRRRQVQTYPKLQPLP